jgi:hypothetical protein
MEIFRKKSRKIIKRIVYDEICEHRNYLYKKIGKKLDKIFNDLKDNDQFLLNLEEEKPLIQNFKDNILTEKISRKYSKRTSFSNKKIDEYLFPKKEKKEDEKKINKEKKEEKGKIIKVRFLKRKRRKKEENSNREINYKGITYDREKYTSRFEHKGRKYSGGRFFIAENAAKAYDSMVFTHLGFQKGKKKFNFYYNSPSDIPKIEDLRINDIKMNSQDKKKLFQK